MGRKRLQNICLTLLIWLLPITAFAVSLDQAAKQAARRNNAKVLSAKTVQRGNARVHHIKLLTKKGVVKTVRVADKSKTKKRK